MMQMLYTLMGWLFALLGRLLYPRRQVWEQKRNVKTLVLTVAFSLSLGLALAKVIRMMYNRQS